MIKEKSVQRQSNIYNFENEVLAPLLAPSWAHSGYEGHLKKVVIEACRLSDNQENQHQLPEQPDSNNDLADVLSNLSRIYNEEENNEEEKEEVEKEEVEKEVEKEEKEKEEEAEEVVVEEVVMLTSSDNRPIDQHSDDDHLEMDD
ncbi:unnamed protein product [Rhizophagus irregularis]|nr:unnamed protein product [Rhizophagus irregularis]